MDNNELPIPAFRLTREAGGLRIRLPVQAGTFRPLLNSIWLLVWVAVETALILVLLGGFAASDVARSLPLPVAALFLGVFSAAGVVILGRWLWSVGGEESFLVSRDVLSVRRGIWGLGRLRTFAPERIRSVLAGRLKPRAVHPSWGRLFIGHGDGQVVIDCAGTTHVYGKGLEAAEAGDLVRVLNRELGSLPARPSLSEDRPAGSDRARAAGPFPTPEEAA